MIKEFAKAKKFTVVRHQTGGDKFEILVDPDKGLLYKNGEIGEVANVLMADFIFTDAKKGEKASADKLEKTYGTSDAFEVAKIMFEKGTFQLNAQQRKEMVEQKNKKIIYIISRTYVDPKTKIPHPPQRIQNAMEEARINIDPFIEAEEQVQEIVDALRSILPMSSENIQIALKIPAEFTGKSYGTVKNYGTIKREEWQNDGSWVAVVELPAAMQMELLDTLGKETQGNVQSKIVN
ncbi:ribosome assembly factor SBDS [Candidatus Bathyarchaeota archaeon]|jgi:ribosome maturation protein SDO1|nr:ribosome assembly factor SBDS [Candidatus Bathyarchaeota archaeon]MBT4320034.1 ribosome assembly factor SBDS [Candidatus Bathyarchaeota archaeon]MBT4423869.1 ribosome assembly factor SBDS [Candidatus Bathyarchaeota archaeon]MBT5641960.1 ribosome assembly factor SBDS [Candidatus Bathyarchaeota archaeon]MBT6604535.1 ribosome assembly factor SBDS [Candidatus Bathyarchaeota archaeon]